MLVVHVQLVDDAGEILAVTHPIVRNSNPRGGMILRTREDGHAYYLSFRMCAQSAMVLRSWNAFSREFLASFESSRSARAITCLACLATQLVIEADAP